MLHQEQKSRFYGPLSLTFVMAIISVCTSTYVETGNVPVSRYILSSSSNGGNADVETNATRLDNTSSQSNIWHVESNLESRSSSFRTCSFSRRTFLALASFDL